LPAQFKTCPTPALTAALHGRYIKQDVDPEPDSVTLWIRIRIHGQEKEKIEVKNDTVHLIN
jgi:hypothetical protein